MPKKNSRKRGSKKRGSSNRSHASNEADVSLAANSETKENGAPNAREVPIRIPSNALMPARNAGDSKILLPVVLPVKDEPTDMETEEASFDNELLGSDDLPLNSQEVVYKDTGFSVYVFEHEFENSIEKTNDSSYETISCIPGIKIKDEPFDPGYDFALTAPERNADTSSVMTDNDEHVGGRIKVEPTDSDDRVAAVKYIKATEQCNEVVFAYQNDCLSAIRTSIPDCFTNDSNSRETVLNMPIENVNTQKDTVFPAGFFKVKQEPNSVDDASEEDRTNKYQKDRPVYIKKEPEDNSTPSVNSAKEHKTVLNIIDVSESKCVDEILTNIPVKSELVSAVNISQSSVPLKFMNITKIQGSESISNCSKTSGEKMSNFDNKPYSHSSISTTSMNSSESEQLEKSNIASLTEWHGKNTSLVALPSKPHSNSQLVSSKITVGSLTGRLSLSFDLSDVLEAVEYISKSTVNRQNKMLYPHKRGSMPTDDNMKPTTPNLPNIKNEIENFISNMKNGTESEEVVRNQCEFRVKSDYSQQESMDVDKIISPIGNRESSLTHTCSDTSVEEGTSTNNKLLFTSAMHINSSKSKKSPFSVNVLPSSELSARPDPISIEQLKQILSMLPKEHVQSSNLLPCYTNHSVTSVGIPCDAVGEKQSVENNDNSNPSDSTYDHSRNSVMNRPIRNFMVNCTERNRKHNTVSTPFIENESTNAKTESGQNYIPTSLMGSMFGFSSFVPPVKSRNQDISLFPTPGSSKNQLVNRATEITRTNNFQQDSKSTPRAEESASLSFTTDSAVSPTTNRRMSSESTDVHNVHSSVHIPCNYENNKKGNYPRNIHFSDKSTVKSAVSSTGEKRKITSQIYPQRKKVSRVDNSDKRKLNSEYLVINSAKPCTTAKEPLRMDSSRVLRDPPLRRNVPCTTTSIQSLP